MKRSRRSTPDLARNRHKREPKRRFILFCEGEKTEIEYFEAISRICSSTLIAVETHGGVGVPYTIAEKAVERAKPLGPCPNQPRRGKPYKQSRFQIRALRYLVILFSVNI